MFDVRVTAGLFGLGLVMMAPTAASAGAWTLPEGTGQAALIGTLSQARLEAELVPD